MRKNGYETFTFITAWNPFSAPDVPLVENERRQAALIRELTSAGLPFLPAVARDADGLWPEEPGVFVFDWALGEALETGRAFGQHAVLRGGVGVAAEVLWCHGRLR